MNLKKTLYRSAALIVPMIAMPAIGHAQVATPAQAANATESNDTGLQDIVVTAQKRGENLQKVPIAITAVSANQLTASGITTTMQLNTVAPGLNIRTTAGSFQPSIRGVGTSSNVVENPVALYIDGVYLPQQREGLRDLNDISQVAVLKGPQGTLFGRNATGGIIQITTREPTHELSGQAGAEIDNYATFKGDVYLSGGLTDTLAASISGQYATQGRGWGDNITTGNDTFKIRHQASARAKFVFEPGSGTKITFIADYINRSALTNSFQPYPGTSYSFPVPPTPKNPYDSFAGTDSYINFEGGGLSLTINQDVGFADLVSISSWRKGNSKYVFDNSGDPGSKFVVTVPKAPNEDYTQELQLVSHGGGDFTWVVGAFYFHNLNAVEPIRRDVSGGLAPFTLNENYGRETTESIAPFGQADWQFLPSTKLTAGIRYTYEKREIESSLRRILLSGATVITPRNEDTTIKKPTFRVALSHDFSPTVLGYLSYNTGIKSGGFNILNAANPGYLPEKLVSYEAGLKTQLLDRNLRLNIAGFYYDYTNLQVIQFVSGIQTIVNGAGAKLYGLDVDFEAQVADGFRLSGGFEIEHSEFTNFANAVFSSIKPGGGAIIGAGNAKGNRLPLAQEFVGTVAADYHVGLGSGSLDFNTTANYNGNYFFEPDNFLRQKSYVLLNASVKYTFPNEKMSVSLFGKNLLDKHVISQPTAQAFGFPTTYGNAPLTFGVKARMEF